MTLHPFAQREYACALSHSGEPLAVPEWDCHVLTRETPGGHRDAVGVYPIAVLSRAADLDGGLDRLKRLGLVSVTLVLDDFHRPGLDEFRKQFDVINPFKTHYIRRNALPFAYGKHHRYEVRRALRKVTVGQFDLARHIDEWKDLYANLVRQHGLGGIHDFPSAYHDVLPTLDGTVAIGAWIEHRLVSAHIWVSDGQYVHSHLAASSDEGYKAGAAYAVYDASIRHFAKCELLNLGGVAGTGNDPEDGLARFKRGFCNDSAPGYICGAILDRDLYSALSSERGAAEGSAFFPAYRTPRT